MPRVFAQPPAAAVGAAAGSAAPAPAPAEAPLASALAAKASAGAVTAAPPSAAATAPAKAHEETRSAGNTSVPTNSIVYKRKPAQSSDTRGAIKPRAAFEEGDPNWPCPSPGCPGHIKIVKKKEGGQFGSCDHRVYGDEDSCDVTTTLLQPSTDHPKFCLVCISPVEALPHLENQLKKKTNVDTPVSHLFSFLRFFFFFRAI